ncbi:Na(+)-translocating NADH-quinone reductase subunit C [uncultured Porticoccus sp.]|uniref:Na(+)-translocating NADH-quinone reductase subunit C n=1 Tax=uncultured Porticoccus sp. TaxID=1256050 RepID=UPI0030DC38CB
MASNDRISKVLTVAVALCLVCSVVVSSAAVLLRDAQEANKARDKKSNILAAAGLLEPDMSVEEQFEKIEVKMVDIATGKFTDVVSPDTYEQRKAAKNPELSVSLSKEEDVAGISRRAKYAVVYLVRNGDDLEKVVLPVRGPGLWSTLYGFIAIEGDLNTVAGLGFYEHGETPGLGGEVDNPLWKDNWPGKKIYGEDGEVQLTVIKGSVDKSRPEAIHQVDGLSGATLTTRGVDNLIEFWMGENGFGKFLSNLKAGEA